MSKQQAAKDLWKQRFHDKWGVHYEVLHRFCHKHKGEKFYSVNGEEYIEQIIHEWKVINQRDSFFNCNVSQVIKYIAYHYEEGIEWKELTEAEKWAYVNEYKIGRAKKELGTEGLIDMIKRLMYEEPIEGEQINVYDAIKHQEENLMLEEENV